MDDLDAIKNLCVKADKFQAEMDEAGFGDPLKKENAALKAENERLRQELAEARCALSGMEAAWELVEELMLPEEATDEVS